MTETTTLRVLHLDDESTVLSTTENYFERFEDDITIETTTNPSDALDRLETGAYDCLLCDYEMPGMDGLAILDRLQGDGPDVPFVMYTGRGSEDVASEAISQGADDYLRKDEGVDHYERLASTIRDAVEDHRAAASTGPGAETGNGPPAHSGSPVDAMVSVDADGRITEIDDQAASLLGSSPEQLRSSRLTENLAGEWTAVVAANVETALTTDAPVGFSLEQSGTTVHGIVRPDSDGATVQFAGEAEAPSTTAHASAVGGQRLVVETLVESLPELFHAFDTEGTLVHWNERVTDVSGYSDEELDLMTVWDLVPAREHRAVADAVDGIIESGTPDRIEIHYLTRQGYEIPYEFTGAPITNEAGDVVGVASLGRDVTERKARQDRLEKTRRQLDMALEETDTGVWIFDPTTTTVTPHGKTAELFGVDPDETDGTVYTQQIHPDDYDAAIEAVRRAADTGEPYDSEFRVQIDGTDRWLESKGKVITDGTDETPEMFGVITDITERKAREEELRTLRQRFERFAENVQDGFFLLSADYSETFFVNSAVEDLYGITPEEAAADTTNWLEHVHPDDRAQLRESVDEQIQGTIEWPVEQEFRVQHPERGQRWIQSRLDVIRDAEGTPVRIAGVATDITEHKERERDLRVRTRTMDEAPIGITITDPSQADNPIIYANDRFLETTGYDREAVLGRNCRFLQGEKTDPETVTEMRDAIDAEQPVTVDVRNYRQDGMLFWNHLVIAPVENEAGEVTSFVGFQQDVTERKARQEKLAASESRFRAVFESSHDALVIADDDGVYVDANPAACELFGVEYEELLGQRVSDFAPEDFDFETAWREFLESDSQRGEFPLERPDGDRRIAEFSATTNVQPGQHLSALRDVTARKAREREIERQNERLELLASTISHDLRNPLRSAQTNLRMAQRECESDLLDDIDAAHERMAELIDDLLTLARQGQAVTETEPVDLAAAAQEAWEGIETAEATLVTDAVTAQADRSRLLQVFENLFVNAISHGREDVTVRVGPTDHGFFVADDGPGVPDDEREYVFEYGYSNAETGTGFGLAIVAEIAQAHGWTVELTDSDTGGARFEFET